MRPYRLHSSCQAVDQIILFATFASQSRSQCLDAAMNADLDHCFRLATGSCRLATERPSNLTRRINSLCHAGMPESNRSIHAREDRVFGIAVRDAHDQFQADNRSPPRRRW